jgi:hypothetical protein
MNRYGQPLPTINKSYMSAIMARQEGDTYSYENIVTPNKHAVRSNVVVGVGERVKIFPESVPT